MLSLLSGPIVCKSDEIVKRQRQIVPLILYRLVAHFDISTYVAGCSQSLTLAGPGAAPSFFTHTSPQALRSHGAPSGFPKASPYFAFASGVVEWRSIYPSIVSAKRTGRLRDNFPMLCPNCHTVNPPNAKFCLECGNRLLICPNCGTVNLPVARFCIECGTPLQSAGRGAAPAAESGVIVEAVAPESPALLLPSEERRVVTVMFADITGSTPLADRLDPEDMRAILTGYFNLMAEQIRKHGGTIEKYIGDAVMAVFGLPIAHEDDPDRAIRAALDMQTALAQFNQQRTAQDSNATRLQMRIGINTGEVAAPGAQSNRQDFLITGDAVNVAARLQQAASPDTILVGERTYLATRNVFEFRELAPFHLKAKVDPVRAWVVQGIKWRSPIIIQHPRGIEGDR